MWLLCCKSYEELKEKMKNEKIWWEEKKSKEKRKNKEKKKKEIEKNEKEIK
jgi:hypothetical protein